jgi:hypothetical protein
LFTFNGQQFPLDMYSQSSLAGSPVEASMANFSHAVRTIHSRSGVVSAAVMARGYVLSQVMFKFRPVQDNGRLFGTPALLPLEQPGSDLTRESLMMRVEEDVAYHGNFYARRLNDGRMRHLRPDWMTILLGSNERPNNASLAADCEVIGYSYKPGGEHSDHRSQFLSPSEVIHFAPEPHPTSNFIGEAWVTSVYREIAADMQATDHVSKYFANAATANMVALAPPAVVTPEQFSDWVDAFDGAHRGSVNAWRTIYAQAGTDVKVIGSQLGDLKMAELQGGFETRVSSRSRVPATVLLIREGLGGSALNSGNYQQTRRLWADSWFSPYAQMLCASFARVIDVPAGAELTFDPARVLLLQEDQKDAADIRAQDAQTIRALVDAGYDPDAAVEYVQNNGDLRRLLGRHSGLYSVQLQEPGSTPATSGAPMAQRAEFMESPVARTSDTHIHLPDSLQVDIARAEPIVIPPPVVHVAAPIVNVAAPNVTVEPPVVNVAAPAVTVEAAPIPAPVVHVHERESERKQVKFKRNDKGDIVSAEVVEVA